MTKTIVEKLKASLSDDATHEMRALGLFSTANADSSSLIQGLARLDHTPLTKRAIHAPQVINEATDYARPSSFSRGMRVELASASMLFLSGTASVNESGQAEYVFDFAAQCLRTYRNLTSLLAAEGASWHDVIRTTCYLRDIERDYELFNHIRTMFFTHMDLNPVPASTGIQARLCWPELLVEMELIAMVPR